MSATAPDGVPVTIDNDNKPATPIQSVILDRFSITYDDDDIDVGNGAFADIEGAGLVVDDVSEGFTISAANGTATLDVVGGDFLFSYSIGLKGTAAELIEVQAVNGSTLIPGSYRSFVQGADAVEECVGASFIATLAKNDAVKLQVKGATNTVQCQNGSLCAVRLSSADIHR